ncbi:hypothetical protein JST97_30230 [bacterium]|nr:hypothetical protein [bacterium]
MKKISLCLTAAALLSGCNLLSKGPTIPKVQVKLPYHAAIELDGKTRKEIEEIRKKEILASTALKPMVPPDYFDNTRPIFKEIVDGRDWIGLDGLAYSDEAGFHQKFAEGPSRDSALIVNPFVLIGTDYAYASMDLTKDTNAMPNFGKDIWPDRVEFDGAAGTLRLHYSCTGSTPANRFAGVKDAFPLDVVHTNAKDLGFGFMCIPKEGLKGIELDGNADSVLQCDDRYTLFKMNAFPDIEVNTYYHRNASSVSFRIHQYPAELRTMLWRDVPDNRNDPPDFLVIQTWDNSDPSYHRDLDIDQ